MEPSITRDRRKVKNRQEQYFLILALCLLCSFCFATYQLSSIVALDTNTNDEHHSVIELDDVRVMNDRVADKEQSARYDGRTAMKYDPPSSTTNESPTPMTKSETHELLKNFVTNHTTAPSSHKEEYMKSRQNDFDSWFDLKSTELLPNADKDGPILDFAVVGYPKCGTTTLMANLGKLAPMPIADVCTPVHKTVYYSYKNWPERFGESKLLRGTKCPAYISTGTEINDFSKYLPRTKLIVGIRHPFKWFKSFWNMQAHRKNAVASPYNRTTLCLKKKDRCRDSCPNGQLFCLHRARFHLGLAKLGKTNLTREERMLLAPNDGDGGMKLKNKNIKNPVFLYEQEELSEDYLWDDLATYLGVESIPHDAYHGSHGKADKIHVVDFCLDEYDDFRSMIMPYAYELSEWIQKYFIPVANDESKSNVVIPRPDRMVELVENYKVDPCGKLIRFDNGTYALPLNYERDSVVTASF